MFQAYKTTFDFCCALCMLIIMAPVFLIIAIVVKLTSSGPIFFRQKRLTKGMREFTILKFRTMHSDFDKRAIGIQVKGSSSAITPVGRFLRKSKLDELPQLINIILGDMSFVGPRPELPRRLKHYTEADRNIFTVKSGISSPASVVLAGEEYLMECVADPESFYIEKIMPFKIRLNQLYILQMSVWVDLKVILATILRITGVNAEGLVCTDSKLIAERVNLEKAGNSC